MPDHAYNPGMIISAHKIARYLTVVFLVFAASTSGISAAEIIAGPAEQLDAGSPDIIHADSMGQWQPYTGTLNAPDGTFWFRQKLTLAWPNLLEANNPLALSVRMNGLYDAYWDGELVASNRHLGKSAPQNSRIFLPVHKLQEGPHTLHFKITGMGLKPGDNINLNVTPSGLSADFFGIHFSVALVFFVTVTSYIASIYFVVISGRGTRTALCRLAAFIMFLAGTLMFLDRARYLTPYPYSWQPTIDIAMAGMTVGFMLALLAYGALRLKLYRALWWPLGIVPVLTLSFIPVGDLETDTRAFLWLGFLLLLMCGFAFKRERKTATAMAIVVFLSLLTLLTQPQEKIFFVTTITLLFGTELGLDIFRRTREAYRLALVSERLRGDLLRQNIKPHFLMNSLTALMEWIETSPSEAVTFIDGLATEFRLLSDFSDRRSVWLLEELALCNVHLDLMSRRLDATLQMHTELVDTSVEVPPALFHTLVENACSHNDYRGRSIDFTLRQIRDDSALCYELSAPVIHPGDSALGTGVGNRYVKARLEEFCGNAFRFQSEQVGSCWITSIKFNRG